MNSDIAQDEIRRHELGDFLRTRRARIAPTDVGLPATNRRRTTGLRREEVAQLAGMSATWYTWLEQKRPIRVSPAVLDNLARVLRLTPLEARTAVSARASPADHRCVAPARSCESAYRAHASPNGCNARCCYGA